MMTGTFVENVFFGANQVYEKFDDGDICLDVAYGMMVGAVQADGHMLLRPEAVSDLSLILGDLISALEPMVNDSVGSEMHEEHLASLATAQRFVQWCALAKQRRLDAHGGE